MTLVYVPAVDAEADLEETAACGSSFFCAAAADAEETEEAVLAADVTTACGLSFCSAAAADAETALDANQHRKERAPGNGALFYAFGSSVSDPYRFFFSVPV